MIWNKLDETALFAPEQLREVLEDYAATTARLIDALHAAVESDESINWRPHLPQMHAALAQFAELCRDGIENLDGWREDGRDLEEIHECVWDAGERLVRWLKRIIAA